MKNKFLNAALAGVVLALGSLANVANAGIIEGVDVNINGSNFNTYYDETTQLTWLDIDSFDDFGVASFNTVSAFLNGTDFHIASRAELNTLYASLPLDTSNPALWQGYANVMSAFTNYGRDLIWGVYEKSVNVSGYSWAYSYHSNWNFTTYDNEADANEVNTVDSGSDDLGFFVVSNQVLKIIDVPAPSTFALFALALIGLATRRIKK